MQKNWKFFDCKKFDVIFTKLLSSASMMTSGHLPPLNSILILVFLTLFLDFSLLNNSIRDFLYFSRIQSTPLIKLMYFSKKSESKKFRPKPLNLPYCTLPLSLINRLLNTYTNKSFLKVSFCPVLISTVKSKWRFLQYFYNML